MTPQAFYDPDRLTGKWNIAGSADFGALQLCNACCEINLFPPQTNDFSGAHRGLGCKSESEEGPRRGLFQIITRRESEDRRPAGTQAVNLGPPFVSIFSDRCHDDAQCVICALMDASFCTSQAIRKLQTNPEALILKEKAPQGAHCFVSVVRTTGLEPVIPFGRQIFIPLRLSPPPVSRRSWAGLSLCHGRRVARKRLSEGYRHHPSSLYTFPGIVAPGLGSGLA
ncbi:hypothetical protein SAMN05519105_1683 [Rhodobacter sp. 24-YEA-8]|nr:hypothetical protein SAMN05519105_1683 [Rhodobacter sp. 24-YEA-8]